MTSQTMSFPLPSRTARDGSATPSRNCADISTISIAGSCEPSNAAFDERLASETTAAEPAAVARLRRETYRWFERWGVDEESCYLMQLAFAELGANVIEHGPRHEGAWMQVTWAVHWAPAHGLGAIVSVLDAGDGVSRRTDDPDLPGADALPELPTGRRGLRMLLHSGVRIERLVLPASPGWPGGHLVSAWTPLDMRARRRVCACPCWEHGYAAARCEQIAHGGRRRVRGVAGGSVACCRLCAAALRATEVRDQVLGALRAASEDARDAAAGLGVLAHRLSGAVADARRAGVPVAQIAAALAGLGRGEDLLEIARTDRDGSKLLWQLAALLAVPDEPTEAHASTIAAREPLAVP